MDAMKKQRIVGGVVLGALLLILVPMVLDFSRDEESSDLNVVVPSAPDPKKMEVLPLDVWSEQRTPEVERETVIEPAPLAEPSLIDRPVETAPVMPQEIEKPVAEIESKSEPKSKPEPVAAREDKVSSIDSGWVVQVVSVSHEDKAIKLRDELRAKGYKAFIVKGDAGGGRSVYRVRVGPELLRTTADQIKLKLRQDTKLDGLVMQYP